MDGEIWRNLGERVGGGWGVRDYDAPRQTDRRSGAQMSALAQADGGGVSYGSTCVKAACAYYVFEVHTLFGFGYHIRRHSDC